MSSSEYVRLLSRLSTMGGGRIGHGPQNTGTTVAICALLTAATLGLAGACRAPAIRSEPGRPADQSGSTVQSPPVPEPDRAEDEPDLPSLEPPRTYITAPDRPDHWMKVRRTVDAGADYQGQGEFDPGRNKISISTRNVAEFTINIDRIPIDWSRLVIISIDGINAELRPRDYSPLLFRRQGQVSWSVVEPD